jgi:CRP/FNR family transcriptional regulator
VPVKKVDEWLKYDEWKTFINSTYGVRFAELINVIDLIAFSKMDEKVLHYLRERAKASGNKTLFITHQQIADELYTSREVISRLLRSMENKGLVRIGRSSIELLNGKKNHNHAVA